MYKHKPDFDFVTFNDGAIHLLLQKHQGESEQLRFRTDPNDPADSKTSSEEDDDGKTQDSEVTDSEEEGADVVVQKLKLLQHALGGGSCSRVGNEAIADRPSSPPQNPACDDASCNSPLKSVLGSEDVTPTKETNKGPIGVMEHYAVDDQDQAMKDNFEADDHQVQCISPRAAPRERSLSLSLFAQAAIQEALAASGFVEPEPLAEGQARLGAAGRSPKGPTGETPEPKKPRVARLAYDGMDESGEEEESGGQEEGHSFF